MTRFRYILARLLGLTVGFIFLLIISTYASCGLWAQPGPYERPNGQRDSGWVFCTLRYHTVRHQPQGMGWMTDFPLAGQNFSKRVFELTSIEITTMPSGIPKQWVVDPAIGDELSTCPIVFTSDVGTLKWQYLEVEAMRNYLLKGGVLWVDDFWGQAAWDYWILELSRVLNPEIFTVVDVPLGHPIFNYPYIVPPFQMTNIGQWIHTDGGTSEQGENRAIFKAVFSDRGDLMVLMSHNTDVFDAWEQEADDGFFEAFAGRGYGLGINVLLHVLTH